ncbi:helix-turn-helix domain-containing protein [Agromyces mediolanus]|uniref:helix-turn-helix transcriptional regulator n=1 Tax=Agromyces mediolanus TaxID=41986 RepID=UPI0038341793
MKSAASLVKQARLLAGYTRAELARAADVASSTVGRIESGDLDPTWTLLGRILAAAGFKLDDSLSSLGDETVIEAATNALESRPERRDDAWTWSWARAGLLDELGQAKDPARVAALAGLASEVATRRGARKYLLDRSLAEVLNDLTAAGANPVITGPAGFDDIDPSGITVYVDDPRDLPLPEAEPYRPTVTAIPRPANLDTIPTELGACVTTPARALIDAYASGGRVADRADAYAARLAARR